MNPPRPQMENWAAFPLGHGGAVRGKIPAQAPCEGGEPTMRKGSYSEELLKDEVDEHLDGDAPEVHVIADGPVTSDTATHLEHTFRPHPEGGSCRNRLVLPSEGRDRRFVARMQGQEFGNIQDTSIQDHAHNTFLVVLRHLFHGVTSFGSVPMTASGAYFQPHQEGGSRRTPLWRPCQQKSKLPTYCQDARKRHWTD